MEKDNGYIQWYQYGCVNDTFIVSTVPDSTKKESDSGLILTTEESVVQDRPFKGTVVTAGPESKYAVGDYVYFQPTSGFDLAFIRPTQDKEMFVLLHNDAVIGKLVADSRDENTK